MMKPVKIAKKKKASILILTLWVFLFLTILAVQIGLQIRQRATLISRMQERSELRFIADSGIKFAIASLKEDLLQNNFLYSAQSKLNRHSNKKRYEKMQIGNGHFSVYYWYKEDQFTRPEKRFGYSDEDGKLNINFAERQELVTLFQNVLDSNEEISHRLAEAIINWREVHTAELTGFNSDDYYASLREPYEAKHAPFELLRELRLVQGFSEERFEKLKSYITVYGDGMVNINTASKEVLRALGLIDPLIDKVFTVRRGIDGIEHTEDDFLFQRTYDIATEMLSFVPLEVTEIQKIDELNQRLKIKTNSLIYRVESHAFTQRADVTLMVEGVYDALQNRIVYWHENN